MPSPPGCLKLSLQLATYFQLNCVYVPNSSHADLLSLPFSYILLTFAPFSCLIFSPLYNLYTDLKLDGCPVHKTL